MRLKKLRVEFAHGTAKDMTPRELCGWARQHGARVVTRDGWPVVNGVIRALGTHPLPAGRVMKVEACLAYWEQIDHVVPEPSGRQHDSIEDDWPARS